MSLKKQLIIIFGALAFIVLVVVGVTFWTFMQWRTTSTELRVHYQRNLLLEQIRADMYRAFKEVPDAVTGDDPQSREEFVKFIKPAEKDFLKWSELPNKVREKEELKTVKIAFDSLVSAAYHAFDLVEAGKKAEAVQFMESNLEDKNFAYFQQVTDLAAASDRRKGALVNEKMQRAQQNAQIVLVVAAIGAVALILLLSAYISADLFKPLRDIKMALDTAAIGDLKIRLEEERDDEIGEIYEAFNKLIKVYSRRNPLAGIGNPENLPVTNAEPNRLSASAGMALQSLLAQIRNKIENLKSRPETLNLPETKEPFLSDLEQLLKAVEQVVAFGFPQELKLTKTNIAQFLYEVLHRFQANFINQAVSLEFDLDPAVDSAFIDKSKLSEGISALVQNAIDSLPKTGGKIGLRARLEKENSRLLIEVADNGKGRKVSGNENANEVKSGSSTYSNGLELAKEVVAQHGGKLTEINNPEQGNFVRIDLPLIISA